MVRRGGGPAIQIRVGLNSGGVIVRPGDFELRQWINTWLFINKNNGTLAAIYKKYTGIDLPPLPTF